MWTTNTQPAREPSFVLQGGVAGPSLKMKNRVANYDPARLIKTEHVTEQLFQVLITQLIDSAFCVLRSLLQIAAKLFPASST